MPRHSDPDVEGRILGAARKLWHKGGEKALSMRAVAKAAGTNTPAVYRRFRTREQILRALVKSYQEELYWSVEPCRSLQEVAECYLDFALRRPREYQLIMSGLLASMTKERPNLEFILNRATAWLGGSPEDHRPMVFAIWSLVHGTAMLRITGTLRDEDFPDARAALAKSVDVLVANGKKLGRDS
jgi:AcrR family transcriptional regulator